MDQIRDKQSPFKTLGPATLESKKIQQTNQKKRESLKEHVHQKRIEKKHRGKTKHPKPMQAMSRTVVVLGIPMICSSK